MVEFINIKEPNKIYIVSFTTDEEKNLCFFSSGTINNSFIAASNFYSYIISNPVKINSCLFFNANTGGQPWLSVFWFLFFAL